MSKGFVTAVILLSLGLSLIGCGKGGGSVTTGATSKATSIVVPSNTASGVITAGPAVAVATAAIGSGGGTIKVTEPGNPLTGLEIKIPAASYSDARQVKISYSPIEKQSFGPDINPLTPLINLDNGGGYSNDWMQVKIPVKVPSGQFAMGFSYDSKRGKLRGLPTVKRDADSITLATQYLTPVVVSSINELLLNESIPSTFKPGIDDWQFTNYGSYIAPGGHCAGQTISALWYFLNKPDGPGVHLYGTYDNNGTKPATPGFWQDDSFGYRFASMIQSDMNWNVVSSKMYGDLFSGKGDIWGSTDADTMKAIAYNMIESQGEPQEVAVYSLAGEGHALIVYGMDKDGLSVADPNYPGDTTRRIKFSNGRFQTYNSGANADAIAKGRGLAFEIIRYVPQDSFIDQAKMQKRWIELRNKAIGNDVFPAFPMVWIDDTGLRHELTDGYVSHDNLVNIRIGSPGTDFGTFVFRDGKFVSPNSNGKLELLPGNNRLGIHIVGLVNGEWKYVDFKYVNVVYRAPSTTPSPTVTTSASAKPTSTPTATPIPVTWKMLPVKIEDKSQNMNANSKFAFTLTSITFTHDPPASNASGLITANTQTRITWDPLPETLTSGQVFTLAFKGAGVVTRAGQNEPSSDVGVRSSPSFSGVDFPEKRGGEGWNGYSTDPSKDTAFVSWHAGQMKTGGQPFWGVNQTFQLLPQKLSPPATITIRLTVSGGAGTAGIDGLAYITYQWQKQ